MKNISVNMREKWLLKFISHKKQCGGLILTMIIVFVVVTFSAVIGEFYRIYILQQDIEYQLQRSVNCAVEFAMGDSYRQDKVVNLDVTLAKSEFYKHLESDIGLDGYNRKYKNGKLMYKLSFSNVSGTSNPSIFTVQGTAEANSIFSFLAGTIKIPFKISSTNFRVD